MQTVKQNISEGEIQRVLTAPEMLESRTRIIDGLLDIASGEGTPTLTARNDQELIFLLSVVSATEEKSFVSRFLIHMRDRYELNLRSLDAEGIEENLNDLGLTVTYDIESDQFSIPFYNYIRHTRHLSGAPYRLVFQTMNNGDIWLRKDVIAKIAREAYVSKLRNMFQSIPTDIHGKVSELLNGIPQIIAQLYNSKIKNSTFELGEVDSSLFPPCIKEFIKEMQDGVNLTHMARFTLVSFLHHIGMQNEGMIELFKTAPDYNERMTVYQVNHISGESSGTEYSPPKCSVLSSNHLCYKENDSLCNQEWLKHPLQYYTLKKKPRKPKDASQ